MIIEDLSIKHNKLNQLNIPNKLISSFQLCAFILEPLAFNLSPLSL